MGLYIIEPWQIRSHLLPGYRQLPVPSVPAKTASWHRAQHTTERTGRVKLQHIMKAQIDKKDNTVLLRRKNGYEISASNVRCYSEGEKLWNCKGLVATRSTRFFPNTLIGHVFWKIQFELNIFIELSMGYVQGIIRRTRKGFMWWH